MTRSVWWDQNRTWLVDQRSLPHKYEVRSFATVTELARAITDMVVRGAPAIGATGAYGMALAAQSAHSASVVDWLQELVAAKQLLDGARPTAVNLAHATDDVLQHVASLAVGGADIIALRAEALLVAERLADADVAANRRIGAVGLAVVPESARILHHCNTGSLATVDFGTAMGVIRAAAEAGKHVHVWVDETRPRCQGARLTTWELCGLGISHTLIVDSAAGMLMRSGKVDLVLFGGDRVAANGDVANKVGSYGLAVLAQANGVPCYAVVSTNTVDLALDDGDQIPVEERPGSEVSEVAGVKIAPEGVAVYNPAFDVTPHRYLTGIITEEGICYPPFGASLRRACLAAADRRRLENP